MHAMLTYASSQVLDCREVVQTRHLSLLYEIQGYSADCVMCIAISLNVWALIAVVGNAANEAVSSC